MRQKKRLGKFKMSRELYDEQWDIFKPLFLEFKTIHIESNTWFRNENLLTFYGESKHFDEIEQGEVTPLYGLTVNFTEGFVPVFNFTRGKDEPT